jgi:hypothetical protein
MNFYSGDAFLDTLAETAFPGRSCAVGLFSNQGQVFRLLTVDGRPISHWPFLDLVEPVSELPTQTAPVEIRPLEWIPWGLRGVIPAEQWRGQRWPHCQPCPFIDWSAYPDWESFEPRMPRRNNRARWHRNTEREFGPLRFVEDERDPAVLAACIAWKSRQYRVTGHTDQFAKRSNVALFEGLHRRGALVVSAAYAGSKLVSAHAGFRYEGRFGYWIPAHDPELGGRYGTGSLLLLWLLEQSYRRGDREFDFLIGDEDYKYEYATHVRIAGPLGTPPFAVRARRGIKFLLDALPWVGTPLRRMRRALRSAAERPAFPQAGAAVRGPGDRAGGHMSGGFPLRG